jgi:hypothetical protein
MFLLLLLLMLLLMLMRIKTRTMMTIAGGLLFVSETSRDYCYS